MYEIYHHGILGQEWGKQNGPPYPLKGGDYSAKENNKILRERKFHKDSIYNKKHFDKVIKTKDTLSTLSYDPNRTKNTDMFYATYKNIDKAQYGSLFNQKVPQSITDDKGNVIGTKKLYKFKIDNKLKDDIKVASEDSGANIFLNLYRSNRNFYNYVTDPNRMQSLFVDAKYGFKGYREARDALNRIREQEKPSEKDVRTVYRMFNYVIPNTDSDTVNIRTQFFKELSKNGYGAVLDTNDAIYGKFKAEAPVIVFDMSKVVESEIRRTNSFDKLKSSAVMAGSKYINEFI